MGWLFGVTSRRRRCGLPTVVAITAWLKFYSVYQEYLAKTLTDKYSTLNAQMDKVLNDANSELNILNQRINSRSSFQSTFSLFSNRWCHRHAT